MEDICQGSQAGRKKEVSLIFTVMPTKENQKLKRKYKKVLVKIDQKPVIIRLHASLIEDFKKDIEPIVSRYKLMDYNIRLQLMK